MNRGKAPNSKKPNGGQFGRQQHQNGAKKTQKMNANVTKNPLAPGNENVYENVSPFQRSGRRMSQRGGWRSTEGPPARGKSISRSKSQVAPRVMESRAPAQKKHKVKHNGSVLILGEPKFLAFENAEIAGYVKHKLSKTLANWVLEHHPNTTLTEDGWSKLEGDLIKAAKKANYIAVIYIVGDTIELDWLEKLIKNVKSTMPNCPELQVIVGPSYKGTRWAKLEQPARDEFKARTLTAMELALEHQIDFIMPNKPHLDHRYERCEQLYHVKTVMNEFCAMLPLPKQVQVMNLEEGMANFGSLDLSESSNDTSNKDVSKSAEISPTELSKE